MKSKNAVKKALAIGLLLMLFPLSSRGGMMAGNVVSTESMFGQTGKVMTQLLRIPIATMQTRSEIGVSDQIRLAIGQKLPLFLQRMIHSRIQHQQQTGYLEFLIAGIEKTGIESSSLARQLASEGTQVRDAYFEYVQTHPQNQLSFLQQQKDFVMVMVRHIQVVKQQSPVMHQQNLQFFSELLSRMKSIPTVSIAETGFWNLTGETIRTEQFVVPSQLLYSGHQGALGAVLDILKTSTYDVYPNIVNRFLRQVRVLFSTSV